MEYYNTARLLYKIEHLPQRLTKVLDDLPPLSGKHQALEHEYSALFGFVKRVESLAELVSAAKTSGSGEDKARHALLRVCNAAVGRLATEASSVKTDLGWAYETRAFMLRESKKRISQVIHDLQCPRPRSTTTPIDNRPKSTSDSSNSPSSQPSEAVLINGAHPQPQANDACLPGLSARRQTIGAIVPICQSSPSRTGVNAGPTSTPRVRNIVRLGSYQNATLFSGSPVAVAIRKRFRDPPPAGAGSPGPTTTPPGTLRGRDYFRVSQPPEAAP